MTDKNWIHETVDRVTSEVFESHVAELRQALVRRTVEEIHPTLANHAASRVSAGEKLLAAVIKVQSGDGPREILQKLLDQSASFCARSALFIVNEEAVAGWQAIGFSNNDALPEFPLDQNTSLFQKILSTQSSASGSAAEMDARFFEKFGASLNGQCHLIPLLRKEKVAAVLYADTGDADASCEGSALDVLARFTSLWLEVRAMRTFAPASAAESTVSTENALPAQTPAWPTELPIVQNHAAAAIAPVARHEVVPVLAQAAFAAAASAPDVSHTISSHAAQSPITSTESAPMSAEDADTHRKAQRFAKLLTDEIKLYNKAKVEEGRKNHDIYDRLRDDIDKSRASYVKRYGNTVAASTDYFSQELIRGLAQEDASLLGPNFQR